MSPGSSVVEPSTRNPTIEGSKPATATGKEKMVIKTYYYTKYLFVKYFSKNDHF